MRPQVDSRWCSPALLAATVPTVLAVLAATADADDELDPDPGMNAFTLELEAGETEQPFTFKSLTDTDDDSGETVTSNFSRTTPPPAGVTEGTPDDAVVTIKPLPLSSTGGGGGAPAAAVPSEADFGRT